MTIQAAAVAAGTLEAFKHLTHDLHLTGNNAARCLGKSPSYFSGQNSMLARYERHGFAGLLYPRASKATFRGAKTEL